MPTLRIVGAGRAGSSLAQALQSRGWIERGRLGRDADPRRAADGVDLCVIATPDAAVTAVARSIEPNPKAVLAHLSGALGLDALAPHGRRASIHPLVSLPDASRGAAALLSGAWFAVAGDPLAEVVVADLGGRIVTVDDGHRAEYHAAACVASNHTVALLAQVERIAASAGVPLAAYLDLVRMTIDNVAAVGTASALTGPAARGDWSTVARHLDAIDPAETALYLALARAAAELAGRTLPEPEPAEVACS
jgi:predicted short-subunit dehydrogenase-like oxidoreductase (DUF2520 family)